MGAEVSEGCGSQDGARAAREAEARRAHASSQQAERALTAAAGRAEHSLQHGHRHAAALLKHLCPVELRPPQPDEQAAAGAGPAGRRLLLPRVVCGSRGRRSDGRLCRQVEPALACVSKSSRHTTSKPAAAAAERVPTRAQHGASRVLVALGARQLQADADSHHVAPLDACRARSSGSLLLRAFDVASRQRRPPSSGNPERRATAQAAAAS